MSTALITLLTSALGLIICMLLFRYEDARSRRLLQSVRKVCDRGLLAVLQRLRRISFWLGAGNVRLFMHAILHHVLHAVLYVIRKGERFVETRLRRNRRQAKAVSRTLDQADHLRQLAEHRESTALDEREKQRRRSFENT